MTSCYKQIQLTNTTIGDVAVDSFIPYGRVTRRINAPFNSCSTFTVTSSTADTVTINDPGFYKITYSLTASAAAAGDVSIALVTNGTTIYSVSQNLVDETGTVNLTLPYTIRVCPNCSSTPDNIPVNVQIQNTGIALTGVSGNMIIEKV
jgi:NMD protein affecting ribosome stability and mRNA decay